MTANFERDLADGEIAEQKLLQIIRKKYKSAVKIPNKFSDYDIFIPETNKKIEVKYDRQCNKTGNIFIEIEILGKPSGLSVTKADYWVFFDGENFRSISPADITNFIFMNKIVMQEFKNSGNEIKAFLVKKDDFFERCKLIKQE